MPERPILRRAGKIATGIALGSVVLGLHRDVNPEHMQAREERRIEERAFTSPSEMLKNPEFRAELKELNDGSTSLLRKYEKKELTAKDVKNLFSQIDADINYFKLEDPQFMRAMIFSPGDMYDDFKALGKRIIDLFETTGKRAWNDPQTVALAELIVLATYIHMARNIRRRGYQYWQGVKSTDPFAFSNYTDVSKSQTGEIAFMLFFAANYPNLAVPIALFGPTVRYYLAKGIPRRVKR